MTGDRTSEYEPNLIGAITAAAMYLYAGQFLARDRDRDRAGRACRDPLAAGTVGAMTARAAAGLDGFLGTVRGLLAGAEVVGGGGAAAPRTNSVVSRPTPAAAGRSPLRCR